MHFKFEKLEVWQLSLDYVDLVYKIADLLPKSEEYNLKSQITRAATSIALNIAEGSTSPTDAEQARFIGLALRSLVETLACQHIISRRKYLDDIAPLRTAYLQAQTLFSKHQSLRKTLVPNQSWIREDTTVYEVEEQQQDGAVPW